MNLSSLWKTFKLGNLYSNHLTEPKKSKTMFNTQNFAVKEQSKKISTQAGEEIGYEKGAKMVKNFVDQNNEQLSAHFIGRDMIESILAQPGAVGITILQGLDKAGQPSPVVVGVNADGNYLLNVTTVAANGELTKQKGIVATGVMSPGTGENQTVGCGWY